MELVTNSPADRKRQAQLDQASAWIACLASDQVNEANLQDFALWLSQDDANKSAYDEVVELWQDLAVVESLPFDIPTSVIDVDADRAANDSDIATADTALAKVNQTEDQTAQGQWINWTGALAVAASLFVLALLLPNLNTDNAVPQQFATGIGEQQTISLDDGSTLTLNTNSRVEVVLTKAQRSITLTEGEAYFEVAKDPQRPFVVNGCYTNVRALGTAFSVRCNENSGTVIVSEGVVRVTEAIAGPAQADSALLEADQTIHVDRTNGLSRPQRIDSGQATLWHQGELSFDNTPLHDVIAELNRYSTTEIKVGSPELADLKVTGRFGLHDTQALLKALESSLPLKAETLAEGIVVLNKASL